jgi:hypothetical protein
LSAPAARLVFLVFSCPPGGGARLSGRHLTGFSLPRPPAGMGGQTYL